MIPLLSEQTMNPEIFGETAGYTKSRKWRRRVGVDDRSVTPQTSLTSVESEGGATDYSSSTWDTSFSIMRTLTHNLNPQWSHPSRNKGLSLRTYRHIFQTFLTACPILCLTHCGTTRKSVSLLKTLKIIYKRGVHIVDMMCTHILPHKEKYKWLW